MIVAFLRTYGGDLEWLPYSLRSIQKFTTPTINRTIVVYPSAEASLFEPVLSTGFPWVQREPTLSDDRIKEKLTAMTPPPQPCQKGSCSVGYLAQIVDKLRVDTFIRGHYDFVICARAVEPLRSSSESSRACLARMNADTDSDSIFTRPLLATDLFATGTPARALLPYRRYSDTNVDHTSAWQNSTASALGMKGADNPFTFMSRQGQVYPAWLHANLRDVLSAIHGKPMEQYAVECFAAGKTFSEFEVMGASMFYGKVKPRLGMKSHVAWQMPPDPRFPIMQKWSWGGLDDSTRLAFEVILGSLPSRHSDGTWTPNPNQLVDKITTALRSPPPPAALANALLPPPPPPVSREATVLRFRSRAQEKVMLPPVEASRDVRILANDMVPSYRMRVHPAEAHDLISDHTAALQRNWEVDLSMDVIRQLKRVGAGNFVDVGANIGSISLPVAAYLASLGARRGEQAVVGFEALDINFRLVWQTLRERGWSHYTLLPHAIVGEEAEGSDLCMAPAASNYGASVLGRGRTAASGPAGTDPCEHPVRALSFTTLMRAAGSKAFANVLFMKMDCEGCEGKLLFSSIEWLKRSPPCHLHMEAQPRLLERYGTKWPDVLALLTRLGYAGVVQDPCGMKTHCFGVNEFDAYWGQVQRGDRLRLYAGTQVKTSGELCHKAVYSLPGAQPNVSLCSTNFFRSCPSTCAQLHQYNIRFSLDRKQGQLAQCEARVRKSATSAKSLNKALDA